MVGYFSSEVPTFLNYAFFFLYKSKDMLSMSLTSLKTDTFFKTILVLFTRDINVIYVFEFTYLNSTKLNVL